jgi:hypothetical protein
MFMKAGEKERLRNLAIDFNAKFIALIQTHKGTDADLNKLLEIVKGVITVAGGRQTPIQRFWQYIAPYADRIMTQDPSEILEMQFSDLKLSDVSEDEVQQKIGKFRNLFRSQDSQIMSDIITKTRELIDIAKAYHK